MRYIALVIIRIYGIMACSSVIYKSRYSALALGISRSSQMYHLCTRHHLYSDKVETSLTHKNKNIL